MEDVVSTTFTATTLGPALGYVITCPCEGATDQAPRFGMYADAHEALTRIPFGTEYFAGAHRTVLPGCEMPEQCPDYPLDVCEIRHPHDVPPAVNIGHFRVHHVMDALGLLVETDEGMVVDWAGEVSAHDLLGRIAISEALSPVDEGLPVTEVPGGGARLIDGGRPAGYLQTKMTELRILAEWCVQRGSTVTWA
jgi:hypothetical protein